MKLFLLSISFWHEMLHTLVMEKEIGKSKIFIILNVSQETFMKRLPMEYFLESHDFKLNYVFGYKVFVGKNRLTGFAKTDINNRKELSENGLRKAVIRPFVVGLYGTIVSILLLILSLSMFTQYIVIHLFFSIILVLSVQLILGASVGKKSDIKIFFNNDLYYNQEMFEWRSSTCQEETQNQ